MAQSHSNYMDGVPVKISEKYKPPPKVSLPQSVQQRLSNTDLALLSLNYDFALEQNVLIKIKEWKAVIENERCERRERIRLKEVEGQKFIEEKQKQLLNELSYPSAEDLSSEDETEETSNATPCNPTITNASDNKTQTNYNQGGYFNPLNKFDTILTPTVVPDKHNDNYNNPIVCETNHHNINNNNNNHFINNASSSTNNTNFYKINYSDFENDTSSPFDNMELKTINDLDILAQCLNTNNSTNNKHSDDNKIHEKNNTTESNTLLDNLDNNLYNFNYNNTESHQNIQNSNNYYNHQLYTNYNNEQNNIYPNNQQQQQQQQQQVITATTTNQQTQQIDNAGIYAPNYNANTTISHNYNNITNDNHNHPVIPYCNVNGYNLPNNDYYFTSNSLPTTTSITNQNYAPSYNNYNHHHQQQQQQQHDLYYSYQISSGENNLRTIKQVATETTVIKNINSDDMTSVVPTAANTKNKSKSVPDIIKELNDELIDSEKKRTRNNSQTITTPKHNAKPIKLNKTMYKDDCRKQDSKIINSTYNATIGAAGVTPTTANIINKLKDLTFNKLSESSQNLATNISSMGFPLERVSRVVKIYGKDDKKIIEHLIPLSELLDLGFDEIKISDALVKFNNNKEKALDFLIS